VSRQDNIYDLVERAAVRRTIPRLELWQSVIRALLKRELPSLNLSSPMDPKVPIPTFGDWLVGVRNAVDRHNDPNSCARILKHIMVRVSDFDQWLRQRKMGARRGPEKDTTGLVDADRKLFRHIRTMIRTGSAQSPYGAALLLVHERKVGGRGSPESRAKRLSARFRRES
jgi:hypothetical protein